MFSNGAQGANVAHSALVSLSLSSNRVGDNFDCGTNLLISSPRCKLIQMTYHRLYCDSYFAEYLCHCNNL